MEKRMENNQPNLNEFCENLAESMALYSEVAKQLMGKVDLKPVSPIDPANVSSIFSNAFSRLSKDPQKFMQSQISLYNDLSKVWINTTNEFLGEQSDAGAGQKDRRFSNEQWQKSPVFKALKESYLVYSNWLMGLVSEVDGLSASEQNKLGFYTKQFLDALSPTNYAWTNPDVLQETFESNAQNVVNGLRNLARDLGDGKIAQTDFMSFEVGKNLATTEGQVVFQNDLLQLIQYKPLTEKVFEKPLLFIPAWINKYYIADLQPKNSFMKWLVEQGYSVFVVSWVNPDARHKEIGFEDYLQKGLLEAVDAVLKATGEKQLNAIGYCLGGTLLATALAYLKEQNQSKIGSATFLTTLLDFSDVGEISVFIDDEQIDALEARMSENGFLDGREMAMTFSMLRANDLIWSFYINNYLLGKTPFPFDILYWNSDATRMPAKMHAWYLRNLYLQNKLIKKQVSIASKKIDISKIDIPAYFLSTEKDHIAPWQTTYKGALEMQNAVFTLAESGHVAGVVNPPKPDGSPVKYGHYVNDKLPKQADKWFEGAKEINKSWWESWHDWNKKLSGAMVAARGVADGLEAAPGSYVKVIS